MVHDRHQNLLRIGSKKCISSRNPLFWLSGVMGIWTRIPVFNRHPTLVSRYNSALSSSSLCSLKSSLISSFCSRQLAAGFSQSSSFCWRKSEQWLVGGSTSLLSVAFYASIFKVEWSWWDKPFPLIFLSIFIYSSKVVDASLGIYPWLDGWGLNRSSSSSFRSLSLQWRRSFRSLGLHKQGPGPAQTDKRGQDDESPHHLCDPNTLTDTYTIHYFH